MDAAGIGVDLLEIERLERALTRRPRLGERLFTAHERAAAARRARPGRHLAARFCAKEAVVKALGLTAWSPQEIEVIGGADGPPVVRLHGRVADRARALGAHPEVSMTHTRELAGAVAVLRA